MVDGHFAIATEAHDDAGLPHTLEHLVFMGSETYPYKGAPKEENLQYSIKCK